MPKNIPASATPSISTTPQWAYVFPILRELDCLGGSAAVGEVLSGVYDTMEKILTCADRSALSTGETRWKNRARWTRARMIKASLLKNNSCRGTWELTTAGRKLSQVID